MLKTTDHIGLSYLFNPAVTDVGQVLNRDVREGFEEFKKQSLKAILKGSEFHVPENSVKEIKPEGPFCSWCSVPAASLSNSCSNPEEDDSDYVEASQIVGSV